MCEEFTLDFEENIRFKNNVQYIKPVKINENCIKWFISEDAVKHNNWKTNNNNDFLHAEKYKRSFRGGQCDGIILDDTKIKFCVLSISAFLKTNKYGEPYFLGRWEKGDKNKYICIKKIRFMIVDSETLTPMHENFFQLKLRGHLLYSMPEKINEFKEKCVKEFLRKKNNPKYQTKIAMKDQWHSGWAARFHLSVVKGPQNESITVSSIDDPVYDRDFLGTKEGYQNYLGPAWIEAIFGENEADTYKKKTPTERTNNNTRYDINNITCDFQKTFV